MNNHYVATLLLEDFGVLVKVEFREWTSMLARTVSWVMTTMDQQGVTLEETGLLREHSDVGPHAAALIAAVQVLGFNGMQGLVTMVHHSNQLPRDAMEHVLYAANLKHAITSLATSASLQ